MDEPVDPSVDPVPTSRVERRAAERAAIASDPMRGGVGPFIWALTRVALGFLFLWAFLDKLFGLGRSTPKGKGWRDGGSPTDGYLSNVDGPFKDFFHNLAGRTWVDWLFMIGLAGLGVALILGIGLRIAAVGGLVLLVMMWMASLPIATNPVLDEHLIYALVILGIATTGAGLRYSLAPWWRATALTRVAPFLK